MPAISVFVFFVFRCVVGGRAALPGHHAVASESRRDPRLFASSFERSFEADTGLKPAIEKVSNYLSLPSPKGGRVRQQGQIDCSTCSSSQAPGLPYQRATRGW